MTAGNFQGSGAPGNRFKGADDPAIITNRSRAGCRALKFYSSVEQRKMRIIHCPLVCGGPWETNVKFYTARKPIIRVHR